MYTVLYVDDEPSLLELGKVFLEQSGSITIETALSAAEGLLAIKKTAFDCIVSDYQMPEMDGLAFLKILRKENNRIPFILFTGRGREEVVIEAVNSGVDYYLQKGGDPRSQFVELEHKIKHSIERWRTDDELKESRQRMTDIIDHLPDATFAIDLEGKVIAWNRAMEEMTGVAKEQIQGTGDHSYALPFYGTRRPILLDLVLREDEETEKKYPHIIRKDNKLISEIYLPILYGGKGAYLWFIASPLYNTHGNVIGAIESIRDITDRKQQDHILHTQLDLGLALQSIRSLENALKICMQAAIEISGMDAGGIYLVEGKSGSVDLILSQNLGDEFVKSISHFPAGSPNARMVMAGKTVYIPYGKTGIAHTPVQEREGLKAIAVIPIISMGRVFACINITSHISDEIPANIRVGLEMIATQIGAAIERIRADEALVQSELRYRNVVEDQTEFISRFLPNRIHIFVNEAYCRYFNKTTDEIIGTTFTPQMPPEDQKAVHLHLRRLTREKPVATLEHRIIMPDGEIHWQQWSDRAIFDESGNLKEYQSVGRDITERKKAEDGLRAAYEQITAAEEELREQYEELKKSGDALSESEENYRALFDEAADLIVVVNAHGTILNMNRKFIEESGYQREEVMGKNVLTSGIVTGPSAAKIAFQLGRMFLGDTIPLYEIEGVTRNGTIIPYEIRATPIIKHGKISAVQATLRNLTERKHAEREISDRKKMLEEIVSGSPIPQFVIDKSHRIISWNRALAEYSGVLAKDVLGTTDTWKAFYDKERPVLADLLVEDQLKQIPEWYAGKFDRSKYVEGAYEATDFFPRMGTHGTWLYFTAAVLRDYEGNIVGAVETLEDITERKVAEEELLASYEQITASEEALRGQLDQLQKSENALRESEENYRSILENIQDAYYRCDTEGNLILGSPSALHLLGYDSESELIGKNAESLYYNPEERKKLVAELASRGAVINYEVTLKRRDGTPVSVSTSSHLYYDHAGNVLGVEGIFRDITERKRAEDALHESERKLRAVFDQTFQFIGLMTPDGTLVEANRTALKFCGITESEILGKPFWETPWWRHSEELQEKLRAAIRDAARGEFVRFEATHPAADGSIHYVDFSLKPVMDDEGHVVLLIPEGRDITERKKMEESLKANEEKYHSLVDTLNVGVYRSTAEFPGTWLWVNPAVVRIYGYDSSEECLEHPVTDNYANFEERKKFIQLLERDGFVRDYELQQKKKDGTLFWVSVTAQAKKSPDGSIAWIDGICDDITAMKDAEVRCRRYQLDMSRAIDYLPDATFIIDRKGAVLAWNRAIEEMTGVQAKDIIGKGDYEYALPFYGHQRPILIDLIFASEDELKKGDYVEIKRTREILSVETPSPILKGKPAFLRAIAAPIYDEEGNVAGAIETITDITELKRALEDLKESENRYRTIFENTGTATVLLEENTIISIANAEFERLSGYPREELEGKKRWTEFVVKEDLERMLAQHRIRREQQEAALRHYEFRFLTQNGGIRNIFLTIDVIPGTKQSVASLMDITERKRAEEWLSKINSTFLAFSPDPMGNINILTELAGKMLQGTCAIYNRLEQGMLCSLAMWNTPSDYVTSDQPEGHICNNVILNGGGTPTIILDLQTSPYADTDPNVRKYQLKSYVGIPVKIREKYLGSLCVIYQNTCSPTPQDLEILSFLAKAIAIEDERRIAMLDLKESEERYSAMVNNAPEPVLTLRKDKILFINDAGVRVSGYSRDEIMGKSILDFLTKDSQKFVMDAMRSRIGKDSVSGYEVEFIRKDGRVIRLIVSAINISYQGEMITLALLVEITERKQAEDALKIANRKLNLLSSITRHDIGNQLLALSGYLELSKKSLNDPVRTLEFTEKEMHIADTIARLINFTRDYEDMGVNAPVWQNVITIIDNVISLLPMREIQVDAGDPDLELFADPLLERVFYNLIDNALRYGGDRMTAIRVSSHQDGEGLVIIFEDDGAGISVQDKNRLFEKGFGKNTGLGLFLSREILGITGITITVNGEPDKGARFEIRVPEGAYRFAGTS
jgi:PAS domain S-box-containing protein